MVHANINSLGAGYSPVVSKQDHDIRCVQGLCMYLYKDIIK